MEHTVIAIKALGLALHPAPFAQGTLGNIDITVLAFFMTANFLVTLGLLGVGILVIGLLNDHIRPWFSHLRKLRNERKRSFSR
jgi:hypothetical protein